MEAVITKLIEQLPSAAAIIIVVVFFIRYIQRRDEHESTKSMKYLEILSGLTQTINGILQKQDAHHAAMLDAVNDMKLVTRRRKNERSD